MKLWIYRKNEHSILRNGKLIKSSNITVNKANEIKELEQRQIYKYLGNNELDMIHRTQIKEKMGTRIL